MDDKKLLEWAKEAAAERINSHMEMQGDEHGFKFIEAENAEALLELKAALLERHLLRERVKQLEIELEQLRRPMTITQEDFNFMVLKLSGSARIGRLEIELPEILAAHGIKVEHD